MTARLAVLVSGRGSNLDAILDASDRGALGAEVVVVIADRPDARALVRAQTRGIAAGYLDASRHPNRVAFDRGLDARLRAVTPDLVVLAGFMRVLGPEFVAGWLGRLVNIHPSLLPAYPGLRTHRRALADGVKVHGASVHFVTAALDGGPVVMQAEVPVRPDDDEASLASRVLGAEHALYPAALQRIVSGQVVFRDGEAYCDGRRLAEPERLRVAEVA